MAAIRQKSIQLYHHCITAEYISKDKLFDVMRKQVSFPSSPYK